MTFEEIKSLIQLINKSDLAEFRFEEGEQKIFYVQIETIKWLTLLNSTVTSQNTYRNYNEKISIFPEINFMWVKTMEHGFNPG